MGGTLPPWAKEVWEVLEEGEVVDWWIGSRLQRLAVLRKRNVRIKVDQLMGGKLALSMASYTH